MVAYLLDFGNMQKTPESVFDTDLSAIAVCDIERKDKIFQNKDQGGLQINSEYRSTNIYNGKILM